MTVDKATGETVATLGPRGEQTVVPGRVGCFVHSDTQNPQTTAWRRVWGAPDPQGNSDPSNYPYIETSIYVVTDGPTWTVRRRTSHRGWAEGPPPNVPHATEGGHPVRGNSSSETLATGLPSRSAAIQEATAVMEATSAIAPPAPPVATSPVEVSRAGESAARATHTLEYLTYHGTTGGAMAPQFDLAAVRVAANIEAVESAAPATCSIPDVGDGDT
jgi:hypothetical protein